MEVICLEEEAFFELIDRVVDRLSGAGREAQKWINQDEAMRLLNIKSPTTMQEYRNNGVYFHSFLTISQIKRFISFLAMFLCSLKMESKHLFKIIYSILEKQMPDR